MIAADIRTVTTKGEASISYDADLPMGVLIDLTGVGKSGDLSLMVEALSQMVKAWSHDGDPTSPEAWRKLRKSEFMEATEAIMADMAAQGNS